MSLLLASSVFLAGWARADAPSATNSVPTVIVVVGAAGEPEFGSNFVRQAHLWRTACQRAKAPLTLIGLGPEPGGGDRESWHRTLTNQPPASAEALWLVLIGHGTFDGKQARFNLRGPDVAATELAHWLKPFRRPLAVIDTSSSSAPFLNRLSASNRVIVTATRSGYEQNYARFGQYFAAAITTLDSDLDQDGQTSLLEAFLTASHQVAEFYRTEGRLATEHALLDDNGDGLGTPADWFRGVLAYKQPKTGSALDGARAHQMHLIRSPAELALPAGLRAERDALELAVARLRAQKAELDEDEYYQQLEVILLELARLYERAPKP